MELEQLEHERVMVVMAHPDDPDFSCAGSVARWADEGVEVFYLLVTQGEAGSDDSPLSPEELAAVRREEQRAAARVLGVKEVAFLDHPDGSVVATLELRRDITRYIRRWRPDLVITGDPTVRYREHYLNHPDHRAAAEAALNAVFPDARNPRQFPELLEEGLAPHRVQEVFLSATLETDVEVDITATIDRKIDALCEHRTQIKDREALDKRLRERYRVDGGNGHVRYMERFKRIVLG